MDYKDLTGLSSFEILQWFEKTGSKKTFTLTIEDPFSGKIKISDWNDICQLYFFKITALEKLENGSYELHIEGLNKNDSFHKDKTDSKEKYGVDSLFFQIDKNTKFAFLHHYLKALKNVDINSKTRILNLGINKGNEFSVIRDLIGQEEFLKKEFVGIDYSKSAIDFAKTSLPYSNVSLYEHDITVLQKLNLGKFDLIISIGTLQSSNLNFNETFMSIFQEFLEKNGSMILGFPNCRWIDGEMIYGAKPPNYSYSELSLVIKDIYFCKKYLQQKKIRSNYYRKRVPLSDSNQDLIIFYPFLCKIMYI